MHRKWTVYWYVTGTLFLLVDILFPFYYGERKKSAMIMNKTEIYEMAMQEMIEENLRLRRKSCTEQEKKQYENVSALAEQVQDILKKLEPKDGRVIDAYVEQIHAIAQKECEYLYAQGVRDGIELLKKLNIF